MHVCPQSIERDVRAYMCGMAPSAGSQGRLICGFSRLIRGVGRMHLGLVRGRPITTVKSKIRCSYKNAMRACNEYCEAYHDHTVHALHEYVRARVS